MDFRRLAGVIAALLAGAAGAVQAKINGNLSSNVQIMGMPAATVGSTADNMPQHTPLGGRFQTPPTNKAQIIMGMEAKPRSVIPAKAGARQTRSGRSWTPVFAGRRRGRR